ncbi:NAD-dependent epimerase/dehydratase family protein [Agrobacterium tumefaciens]|uniref:thioester reductase domain-containing protein n=1 Tax=Agrobacterium TaxID=357 RepID=UPI001572204E|nr:MULTISPECIES: thioester reductase domain-containing protein [Agrobacterium]MCZ4075937.1 thioester reductase domain-containing protein [Agrobacterium sp. LMR679]NTB97751.1 NAD-dependent epimerase/dehydratase family protein [Agrobacterium tumefaciens]NTC47151.1 NAD-dependent epimerase/dehydratase family protein [Agrobacterium tumefaciens]
MTYQNDVENILLTGATGVMGGRLLQELLSATKATIYCLVRAADMAEATSKIESVLFCYDEERSLKQEAAARIVPVLGDVSKSHLGLQRQVWRDLAARMDIALHCAANVNLIASYSKIAPVNVGGSANMVEFCLEGKIPLMHTSSFSVIGDKLYEDFTLYEDALDVGQRFPDMDYERSKFESEKLMHAAGQKGLDFIIVRPGNIWGDSRTGRYPLTQTKVKGIYYEAVRAVVETGFTFASDEDFDITPVDYVARASLYLAMNWRAHNRRTFNLVNPRPIDWNTLVEQVRDCGYVVRELSRDNYFDALNQGRMLREGKAYSSVFTDLLSMLGNGDYVRDSGKYDTANARKALAGSGISCHECDVMLMMRYLDYAFEKGFLPLAGSGFPLAEISRTVVPRGFMERLYDAKLA